MGINIKKYISLHGFTLIEMVIVVGVVSFVMPVMFAIIFIIFQQQARIYNLQEVKKQGDGILNTVKSTIRTHGKSIVNPTIHPSNLFPTIIDVCPIYPSPTLTPAPFIFLYDKNETAFAYVLLGDTIASQSAQNNIVNLPLTNNKVRVTNLEFSCYRSNQFSPPIISTSYDITRVINGVSNATLHYATKFKLRNY